MTHPPNLVNPTPQRPIPSRPFILASSPSSSSSPSPSPSVQEDDTPLPFPAALPRTDFLSPTFDAATYLSSLPHRHQTLEDLRTDLRERSAAISAELLDLVNANYASFLGLGDELKGGEDRVEDVRVALLGFRRAIEDVRTGVRDRRAEVSSLTKELRVARGEIETGRKMLELDDRISALEGRLAVGSGPPESDGSEDEYDVEDDDVPDNLVGSNAAKLMQLASDYVAMAELADNIGRDAPFVRKLDERMIRCRNTLLLDLNAALKEARKAGLSGRTKLFKLMSIYATLDAQAEAAKAFRSS